MEKNVKKELITNSNIEIMSIHKRIKHITTNLDEYNLFIVNDYCYTLKNHSFMILINPLEEKDKTIRNELICLTEEEFREYFVPFDEFNEMNYKKDLN